MVSPKLAIYAAVALGLTAVGFHYRHVISERDQLATDYAILKQTTTELEAKLELERSAAAQALSDRADAQRALDRLREGREGDVEAQTWGAQPIPAGERLRLCEALSGATGCPDTTPAN